MPCFDWLCQGAELIAAANVRLYACMAFCSLHYCLLPAAVPTAVDYSLNGQGEGGRLRGLFIVF